MFLLCSHHLVREHLLRRVFYPSLENWERVCTEEVLAGSAVQVWIKVSLAKIKRRVPIKYEVRVEDHKLRKVVGVLVIQHILCYTQEHWQLRICYLCFCFFNQRDMTLLVFWGWRLLGKRWIFVGAVLRVRETILRWII